MRHPDPSLFAETDRLRVLPLDVTSPESIADLIGSAGSIDALVNNAELGAVGAFEAMLMSLIRQLVETNTIGVMVMCQAVIPQMRARRTDRGSSTSRRALLWENSHSRQPIPPPNRPLKASRLRSRMSSAISGSA